MILRAIALFCVFTSVSFAHSTRDLDLYFHGGRDDASKGLQPQKQRYQNEGAQEYLRSIGLDLDANSGELSQYPKELLEQAAKSFKNARIDGASLLEKVKTLAQEDPLAGFLRGVFDPTSKMRSVFGQQMDWAQAAKDMRTGGVVGGRAMAQLFKEHGNKYNSPKDGAELQGRIETAVKQFPADPIITRLYLGEDKYRMVKGNKGKTDGIALQLDDPMPPYLGGEEAARFNDQYVASLSGNRFWRDALDNQPPPDYEALKNAMFLDRVSKKMYNAESAKRATLQSLKLQPRMLELLEENPELFKKALGDRLKYGENLLKIQKYLELYRDGDSIKRNGSLEQFRLLDQGAGNTERFERILPLNE